MLSATTIRGQLEVQKALLNFDLNQKAHIEN